MSRTQETIEIARTAIRSEQSAEPLVGANELLPAVRNKLAEMAIDSFSFP